MSYYVEYTLPADAGEQFEIPVSEEKSGYTVPLSETDAPVISTEQLPVRSGVFGSTLEEAKTAAEEIISHSKAERALLYEDSADSNEIGAGKLVSQFAPETGWQAP